MQWLLCLFSKVQICLCCSAFILFVQCPLHVEASRPVLCQVCGRDTKRHYTTSPDSFGTPSSHLGWGKAISTYRVKGLFWACLVCPLCSGMLFILRSLCARYVRGMGVVDEYEEYLIRLIALKDAVKRGMLEHTTYRNCWRLWGVQVTCRLFLDSFQSCVPGVFQKDSGLCIWERQEI